MTKVLLVGDRFRNFIDDSFLSKFEIDILDIYSLDIIIPKGYDLIVWDGNSIYPTKDKGSVLIYVGNNDVGDSLTKVFSIKANATILVKDDNKYDLVDALGNLWCRTSDPVELLNHIFKLYSWTKGSIRKESLQSDSYIPFDVTNMSDMYEFCDIIKNVSNLVENKRGNRYFGNASTRCSKMFPSVIRRSSNDKSKLSGLFDYILVSKRNISKEKIQPDDFVITKFGSSSENCSKVLYFGNDKPSVDTPSQLWLYTEYPNINYMIHGHAYISGSSEIIYTDKYCSCGDLREVSQVKNHIQKEDCNFFIINLINHGFIIASDTLDRMRNIVNGVNFVYRNIGEELVKLSS